MAVNNNGKTIYQLTSASALNDTDLFAISSANNLTRSVTLSQIRLAVIKDLYGKDIINDMFNEIRSEIKEVNDSVVELNNDVAEFRNEFNIQLQEIRSDLDTSINNLRSELNSTMNLRLSTMETSLKKQITDLDTRLTNSINGLISYGTEVPTVLGTGKMYLQYFN